MILLCNVTGCILKGNVASAVRYIDLSEGKVGTGRGRLAYKRLL